MNSSIGIGITVRNRNEMAKNSLAHMAKHFPEGAKIVIVDDASEPKCPFAFYRFDTNVGVAKSKNKCLELLDNCEHIFLFDDDCYPINDGWWQPYVNHDEPHLMYQFPLAHKPASDMQELYRDEDTVAYSHTRGAMIYLERRVLDIVGGFDTEYGLGYFEHPDFTTRVYNARLTTHRAMDVPNSSELLYCLDQDSAVESSLVKDAKRHLKNFKYYKEQSKKDSVEFKPYK